MNWVVVDKSSNERVNNTVTFVLFISSGYLLRLNAFLLIIISVDKYLKKKKCYKEEGGLEDEEISKWESWNITCILVR